MLIRRANPADAAPLAALAERIFRDTFAAQNNPDDLDAYLGQAYGEAQQAREIADDQVITLLVEDDGVLIAFAQLRRSTEEWGEVELARFYVDRDHHGRGLSRQLMDACLAAAQNLGGPTLWLGVWEHNPRAIAFYKKCGFVDVGSHPFLIGSDLQTDRVMMKSLQD